MKRREFSALTLGVLAATASPARERSGAEPVREIAEAYVKLVLALGQHDSDYVDAFYGPAEWKQQAEATKRPVAEIRTEAQSLIARLQALPAAADEAGRLRVTYLVKQLEALVARADFLSGERLSFDQESKALYDAVAPTHDESEFREALAQLEAVIPKGSDTLSERYSAFSDRYRIPREKLDQVFAAALKECRARTSKHVSLPEAEDFDLEYVTGKSWSGYNWYQGRFKSLIQMNVELPISIDRALDLAGHEGYPGHHVYNVLLESNLVRDRGCIEMTVYPLFSPQSLIAEGTANYGLEVAFPGGEKQAIEAEMLFPLAGLDPKSAAPWHEAQRLMKRLSYAGNEAARRYLEGRIDRDAAAKWLETYTLSSLERARQRVRFFDQYRSYVINYNLGQDLARAYVEKRMGSDTSSEARWREFKTLLSSQRLPDGLR